MIGFACDNCGRTLRTADDKGGRNARCPQCGESVVVPSFSQVEAGFEPPEDPGPGPRLPDVDSSIEPESPETCPVCGATLEHGLAECPGCGEPVARSSDEESENLPALEFSESVRTAWQIYTQNFGMAIVGILPRLVLTFVACVTVYVAPVVAILLGSNAAQPPSDAAIIMIAGAIGVLLMLLSIGYVWLTVGQTQFFLKLVRGREVEIADIFRGGRYLWRMCEIGFVIGLFFLPSVLMVSFAVVLVFTEQTPLSFGGAGLIMLAVSVVSLWITVTFLPVVFVLVDRDLPGLQSVWEAARLTKGHRITILSMVVVVWIVNGIISSVCWLAPIFTLPMMMSLIAVAWCRLAGHSTVEDFR